MSDICSFLFPCQHLKDEYGDGKQNDQDVLFVFSFVFLPVEGLIEKDNQHQKET